MRMGFGSSPQDPLFEENPPMIPDPAIVEGRIQLHDYDSSWVAIYLAEETRIRDSLGNRALLIEHVGSTSVPGLAAKPIVDITLAVGDSADEASYAPFLERSGYVLRAREPEWYEHRLFKGTDRAVNLHVFTAGSEEIDRMINLRDHLRSHEADRAYYLAAKRALAKRRWQQVQDYADAKTDVIEEILARANRARET
jgi:GrpB-like predicted nucleotidyltransferase (UPF0157 family)